MHLTIKGLIGLVVLCLPGISLGQIEREGAFNKRIFIAQKKIQASEQEAKFRSREQFARERQVHKEIRTLNLNLQRQVRARLQVQQERIHIDINERTSQWRNDQQANRRERIEPNSDERNTTRTGFRSSGTNWDRDDPFLKEMRDEARQLRTSSTSTFFNLPLAVHLPSVPFLPDLSTLVIPSNDFSQFQMKLKVIRPDLEHVRENLRHFMEQMEAFKEIVDLPQP